MDDKAFPLHEHNWHNWLVSMNGIAVERHAVERHAVVFSHGLILPSAENLSAAPALPRAREREGSGGEGVRERAAAARGRLRGGWTCRDLRERRTRTESS